MSAAPPGRRSTMVTQGKNGVMYMDSWLAPDFEPAKPPLPHVVQTIPCINCGILVRHKRGVQDKNLNINGLAKDAAGQLFTVCGFSTKGATVHLLVGIQNPKSPFAQNPEEHRGMKGLLPVLEDEQTAMTEALSALGKRGRCWVIPRHPFEFGGVTFPANQLTNFGADAAPVEAKASRVVAAAAAAAAPPAPKKQKTCKGAKSIVAPPGQRSLKSFFSAE